MPRGKILSWRQTHRGKDPVNEALGIKFARSSDVDHPARNRFVSRGVLILSQTQFAADLFVCGRQGPRVHQGQRPQLRRRPVQPRVGGWPFGHCPPTAKDGSTVAQHRNVTGLPGPMLSYIGTLLFVLILKSSCLEPVPGPIRAWRHVPLQSFGLSDLFACRGIVAVAKNRRHLRCYPNGKADDPLTAFGLQDGSARAKVLKMLFASLGKSVPLAKLDNASLRILERRRVHARDSRVYAISPHRPTTVLRLDSSNEEGSGRARGLAEGEDLDSNSLRRRPSWGGI